MRNKIYPVNYRITMLQGSSDVVYESPESRQSADEMDERRQRNMAYEYLCHLEEAKMWLEAVLRETLPPTTELEENLRNGVYLAKLGHLLAPDDVPLARIYDLEQKRYNVAGLQFRHTDNINYWLKSLEATELPKTFHPETTDVYDKKGMPKVIFCIHALSTHLYKLGRAPLIQDLYGKVNFTDAEIDVVQRELKKYGIQMPSFQKIGGILANDVAEDAAALHAVVIAINEIIDEGDNEEILRVLTNPDARLEHVLPYLVDRYRNILCEAKFAKSQSTMNRSSNESYVPDIYDELLTHAEIQGHITTVNVQFTWDEIVKAVREEDYNNLATALLHGNMNLKDVNTENIAFYAEEILSVLNNHTDLEASVYRRILQTSIHQSNRRAEYEEKVSQAVKLVNIAVIEGSLQSLHSALANPVLALQFSSFALPLYLEEMKADRLDSGKDLTYNDIKASIQVLTRIADISLAVDSRNAEHTWDCLYSPDAHFTDLDPAFRVKYWQALFTCRQQKLEDNCECPVLSYFDIQECVDLVNQQCEDSNQIILALQLLNAAIQAKDSSATLTAVQNPVLQLGDCISTRDSALLLRVLEDCWIRKQNDGAELWLEDVQEAVKYVLIEAEEVLRVSRTISHINTALWSNGEECHLIENLQQSRPNYSPGFQELQYGKGMKSKYPWIAYRTARGNIVYLNLKTSTYSWTSPKDFHSQVQLSERDLQSFLGHADANQNKMTNKLEPLVIGLQSYCRGYLLRKTLYQRRLLKSAVQIQAWWRGVKVRRELKVASKQQLKRSWSEDLLSCYKSQEQKIVKLQALWRGRLARRAFLSLFHQAQPSFKVVQQFAPLLAVNPDDYNKEMQLQSLKGQVVQTIRHNKQLAHQLDTMDIKIGLLVHNRISLQDVEAHSKNLNDLAKGAALIDHTSCKGLKSLTKESRKLLEGYQNLFYMLQTNPLYLAKLMFCLPQTKSTKFLNTVILVLFNFGSNLRENYLLLRLFQTALKEEIKSKVQRPSDMITTVPHVMHLVFEYARQMVGQVSLRNMLGPLVQKILDNKTLAIDTNPIDIYKSWRNREEMVTGKSSDLPLVVNQEKALSYKEVQQKLKDGIKALKETTLMFLEHITQSRDMIPYGVLYMAKVLHNALIEKFPCAPEKDILKVVGNFIYYHFINSAIVGPDSFGIIDLPANQALTPTQRYNLASIAKILQFAASKKGFGEESRHLMCLNPFIIECHKKFKRFFRSCCEVEELENHFSIHQYSEATLISRPVIYITVEEICDTHKLLVQYLDRIVTDPLDPLCELLDEMGPAPSYETLLGSSSNDAVLLRLAKTQLCLTLENKFEVPEDDVTDINKLFIKAKELLVHILPSLRGNSLLEGLTMPETEERERLYADMLKSGNMLQDHNKGLNKSCSEEARTSLQESKRMLREYLCKLELAGLVSQEDGYQSIITAIAHDICNKGKYRQILMKELQTLRSTKISLDQKTKFYEEQVALYNQYIEKCLENLTAGKRNVHSLKSSDKVPKKIKSKLVLKYTAAKLHEKGVLLEVEGLPESQFKNVQFEIAPTDHNGVFTIRGKFMGVEMEKVAVDIQDLLQLQFEGISIMDMFGKAKNQHSLVCYF